ncbi:MAG TPA: hypothetical protein VGJ03_10855 [Acidimicrobiales bacterium]|jgi:hypothetical protein
MAAMPRDANPDDERMLDEFGAALADAVEAALPGWVVRCVEQRAVAWAGSIDPKVTEAAHAAGERARAEVGAQVRALLALDIDAQRTNPLSIVRGAVRYPTEILRAAGVPPVRRDEFAERAFPDDIYDLSPASFADVDQSLHEPGLVWGAAKAHIHLTRHRT